jgi:hypothetical protein
LRRHSAEAGEGSRGSRGQGEDAMAGGGRRGEWEGGVVERRHDERESGAERGKETDGV